MGSESDCAQRWKALVRLLVPQQPEVSSIVRPLEISASEFDVLAELKPDGRVSATGQYGRIRIIDSSLSQDETVLTVATTDIKIEGCSQTSTPILFLHLTRPHHSACFST